MPGLESFCVHCAIGLGAIFLLQCTWFVAWLSLDEARIESGRDGLVPCIVHKDYKPPACSSRDNGQLFFRMLAKMIKFKVFKLLVIVVTFATVGVSIWGSYLMRREFDPVKLMPADSYLRRWLDLHNSQWPKNGYSTQIFTGPIDYTQLQSMERLVMGLELLKRQKKYINGE